MAVLLTVVCEALLDDELPDPPPPQPANAKAPIKQTSTSGRGTARQHMREPRRW